MQEEGDLQTIAVVQSLSDQRMDQGFSRFVSGCRSNGCNIYNVHVGCSIVLVFLNEWEKVNLSVKNNAQGSEQQQKRRLSSHQF